MSVFLFYVFFSFNSLFLAKGGGVYSKCFRLYRRNLLLHYRLYSFDLCMNRCMLVVNIYMHDD